MSAPGGAPTVRRRDQGLREANRTPATEVNPSKAVKKRQRSPGEAEGEQENTPGTRRKAGGGGAGQSRPQRADRGRQRRLDLEPAQDAALQRACAAYHDPERRRAACAQLRHEQRYDAELPLSPPAVPCSSPECGCKMSYRQLANSLGLGSPSVVRCPAPPQPHIHPPPCAAPSPCSCASDRACAYDCRRSRPTTALARRVWPPRRGARRTESPEKACTNERVRHPSARPPRRQPTRS